MALREDYLFRLITVIRQALARILQHREAGEHEFALMAAFEAQQKLFGRPLAELSDLDVDQLLDLLRLNEPGEAAREKIIGYGLLLRETGLVYGGMGLDREVVAMSCFQLSLRILLTAALEAGDQVPDQVLGTIRDLLTRIPVDEIHEPSREMLRALTNEDGPGTADGSQEPVQKLP